MVRFFFIGEQASLSVHLLQLHIPSEICFVMQCSIFYPNTIGHSSIVQWNIQLLHCVHFNVFHYDVVCLYLSQNFSYHKYTIFSCDSSSIGHNVCRSVGLPLMSFRSVFQTEYSQNVMHDAYNACSMMHIMHLMHNDHDS